MNAFKITEEMKQYISWQRTGILNNHGELYYSQMKLQWDIIKGYINRADMVLDIGCGLSGIDYFIGKENENAVLNLLDKTEIAKKIYYGYQKEGAYYNSMELAIEFLRMNGIENSINILTPEDYIKNNELKFDAIISLISCGFHYPVSMYIDAIDRSLNDNGIVILDIRHGAIKESEKVFKEHGFKSGRIHIFEKCDKIMFIR